MKVQIQANNITMKFYFLVKKVVYNKSWFFTKKAINMQMKL